MTHSKQQLPPHEVVTLHTSMPDLLFRHRRTISQIFRDPLAVYQIGHVSIHLITPDQQLISFSSTPTMMYHLIMRGLWQYDGTLSPTYFKQHAFFLWENTYPPEKKLSLMQLKEHKHRLYQGFTLVRHFFSFYVLYSFATKNSRTPWRPYVHHINELLRMGDYCYKSIRRLAAPVCKPYVLPTMHRFIPYQPGIPNDIGQQMTNRSLRLVIDH